MKRPLLITDCDEVLLHMVKHFGVWLHESHDIDFSPNGGDFATSMKRRSDGSAIEREEMWGLLNAFFPSEMDRQTLVPHAREALVGLRRPAPDHSRRHARDLSVPDDPGRSRNPVSAPRASGRELGREGVRGDILRNGLPEAMEVELEGRA